MTFANFLVLLKSHKITRFFYEQYFYKEHQAKIGEKSYKS